MNGNSYPELVEQLLSQGRRADFGPHQPKMQASRARRYGKDEMDRQAVAAAERKCQLGDCAELRSIIAAGRVRIKPAGQGRKGVDFWEDKRNLAKGGAAAMKVESRMNLDKQLGRR